MAVRLRLKRLGRINRPFFRIEVMDSRTRRDGRTLEQLGFYDPLVKSGEQRLKFQAERIRFWWDRGARPTPGVRHLLAAEGYAWPKEKPPRRRERKLKRAKRTTISERSRKRLTERRRVKAKGERMVKLNAELEQKRAAKAAAALAAGETPKAT